jgi:hypothetical protein
MVDRAETTAGSASDAVAGAVFRERVVATLKSRLLADVGPPRLFSTFKAMSGKVETGFPSDIA